MSKKCFIIMPITTPEHLMDNYRGDKDHFVHVLDHLFVPAIEKAGLEPVPPKVKGSEIIQAEILKNLDESDMVLCDMSILNPNVFFELGIRTALNKPVSIVKDFKTEKVPFDTSIINYHEYKGELDHWDMKSEIDDLSEHLKACVDNGTENSMWRKFGLNTMGHVPDIAGNEDDKFDLLMAKVEGLSKKISISKKGTAYSTSSPLPLQSGSLWDNQSVQTSNWNLPAPIQKHIDFLIELAKSRGVHVIGCSYLDNNIRLKILGEISSENVDLLFSTMQNRGLNLEIEAS